MDMFPGCVRDRSPSSHASRNQHKAGPMKKLKIVEVNKPSTPFMVANPGDNDRDEARQSATSAIARRQPPTSSP